MPDTVLRVRESFTFDDAAGVPRVFRKGEIVRGDDPAVKGHESLFEPAVSAARAVEVTTAAPGERRSLSKVATPSK